MKKNGAGYKPEVEDVPAGFNEGKPLKKAKKKVVVKKATLSPKEKKIQQDYEREWASILLKDKKKVLEDKLADYYDEEYIRQEGFDEGTVCGYESAQSDFKRINKITWVLTVVNIGILLTLIIKNI